MEAVIPEALVLSEPVADGGQLFGEEAVATFSAVALFGDQAGIEEDAKVLGDGGAGHLEVAGDRVDGAVFFAQQVEDVAARGVGDGGEDVGLALGGGEHGCGV